MVFSGLLSLFETQKQKTPSPQRQKVEHESDKNLRKKRRRKLLQSSKKKSEHMEEELTATASDPLLTSAESLSEKENEKEKPVADRSAISLPEALNENMLAEIIADGIDAEELPTPPPSPQSKEEKDVNPRLVVY